MLALAMHELCPGAIDGGVYGKDIPGLRERIGPGFDLIGAGRVLAAGDFDAGLYLAERNGRDMERAVVLEGIAWKVRQTTLSENISRTV